MKKTSSFFPVLSCFFSLLLLIFVQGCAPAAAPVAASPALTESMPTITPEPTPSLPEIPVIPGSSVQDIILSLEESIPRAKRKPLMRAYEDPDRGYTYSSTGDVSGQSVGYFISTNRHEEITSAEFIVNNNLWLSVDDLATVAAPYLAYCATMPYDTRTEDARTWVLDYLSDPDAIGGESIEATFGDADFRIVCDESGAKLTITAIGYYDYTLEIAK